jgi:2-phospho-L-lactate guanylyltransferase
VSVIAVVPVRALEGAKSRLGEALDAEERRDLVVGLLRRTLEELRRCRAVDRTIVVSADEEVLSIARSSGAIGLRQTGGGLNAALDQARAAAVDLGASSLLVLPGDLPAITAEAVDAVLAARPAGSSVVLVADRHGRGTNALVLTPPDVVPFAFGGDSRLAHATLARTGAAAYVEVDGPLALDLDTPDDLLLARPRTGAPG